MLWFSHNARTKWNQIQTALASEINRASLFIGAQVYEEKKIEMQHRHTIKIDVHIGHKPKPETVDKMRMNIEKKKKKEKSMMKQKKKQSQQQIVREWKKRART